MDVGLPGDRRAQVWLRSSHLPGRRSHFCARQKCPYHVTFDLDLEHTLDACLPGDHRVQVWWRSGHLSVRSDLRKSLQTDRQMDGRTDDRRRAIALAHSWNELKTALVW